MSLRDSNRMDKKDQNYFLNREESPFESMPKDKEDLAQAFRRSHPPVRASSGSTEDSREGIKESSKGGEFGKRDRQNLQKILQSNSIFKRILIAQAFAILCLTVLVSFVFYSNFGIKRQCEKMVRQILDLQEAYNGLILQNTGEEVVGTESVEMTDGTDKSTKGRKTAASGEKSDVRYVYLTFDDGPSSKTEKILDILDRYGVKATFFVCGKKAYEGEYKRIVEEGHSIGMHSFSHSYGKLYASLDSFQTDLHKLQNYIYDLTGVWTTYYRFPGGSSNTTSKVNMQELKDYLGREHITYFDWNVYGGDGVSSDVIVRNVTANITRYDECMILFHDANDKESTVEALPRIIEYIQSLDNTVIVPITDKTEPVQHHK